MRTIYVLLILLLLPCTSYAKESFKSQEKFSKWLMFYYQNPEPEKIPDAVKFMSKSGSCCAHFQVEAYLKTPGLVQPVAPTGTFYQVVGSYRYAAC